MARIRREKKWSVAGASQRAVRDVVLGLLAEREMRITAQSEDTVDGEGGSALSSAFLWTDKTAPHRVRIGFWETSEARVVVEAAFEERPQIGKAGPVKAAKYSRLADQFLDDLRGRLGRVGHLASDSGLRQAPAQDVPDQITRLAGLRDAGFVTDAEFELTKTSLLARM